MGSLGGGRRRAVPLAGKDARVSGDEGRVDPWGMQPEAVEQGAAEAPPLRTGPAAESRQDGDEITFERIRERAYDLWERNHRPEGLEIQFWLVAERELRAERERRLAEQEDHSGKDRETQTLSNTG
jgi:hypothetical protein